MKPLRFLVVVLLLPHLAACGGATTRQVSTTERDKAPSETARPAAAPEEEDRPADGEPEDRSEPAETAAPKADGSGAAPTAEPQARNTMAISVEMDPSCVRRSERTTMTVKTERFSDVSYGVSYKDGQNHGQYGIGRTDAQGVFEKAFIVPLKAAVGEATVLLAAMNADTHHGGSAQATFEVASTTC